MGVNFGGPLAGTPFSTQAHYALQALLNHKLYKHTHGARLLAEGKKMGMPLLIRCDETGAYGYTPPEWAVRALPEVLKHLAKSH